MASIPTTSTATEARRSWRERLKAPRQLALTRAGKFFVLMTLAVGFGAINTGNNLLFLLFGMMLSLILASGVLSEAVIRNVRLRRRLPGRLFAEDPAPGHFRLTNHGWWPALSIVVAEQNPLASAGPLRGERIGPVRIPWWKFWRQQTEEETRHLAATYCLRASANEDSTIATHYTLPARGRFQLDGLQVSTRFPFGLFEKSREFSDPAEVVVLPKALPAAQWLGTIDARSGETARNQRGNGEEFFGLRDYRSGEDRRAIHWKSTARRGAPVIRENEARQKRALTIFFDNRSPDQGTSPLAKMRFEQGVSHLAGLLHALQSRGYRTELISCDAHVRPQNPDDIEPLLRHLAVVELRPAHSEAPTPRLEEQEETTRVYVGFTPQSHSGDALCLSFAELASLDEEQAL